MLFQRVNSYLVRDSEGQTKTSGGSGLSGIGTGYNT